MQDSAERHRTLRNYRGTPHPWMAAAKCAAGLAVLLLLLVIGVTGDGNIVQPPNVTHQPPARGS